MRHKRSNENTIKVWITSKDLKDRNINLLDLMEDKTKVQSFFYSILEEVDDDNDFQNNDLVSFQIMPEADGFQMVISKDSDVVSKLTEANVNFMNKETKDKFDEIKEKHRPIDEFNEKSLTRTVPVYFEDFEKVIYAVNAIGNTTELSGMRITVDLYKEKNNYYLIFKFSLLPNGINAGYEEVKNRLKIIDNQLSLVYEYGHLSAIHADDIEKNGKLIIKNSAINTIRNYFN